VQHSDPDVLALVALGEPPAAADAEHLLECERCRADVEELRAVVSAVRVDVPTGPPVAPPDLVWQGIAAATGVRTAPRPEQVGVSPAAPSPAPPAARAVPDELAVRRNGRAAGTGRRTLLAVAAAALVLGAVGGVAGSRLLDQESVSPPNGSQQVLAQVALSNLQPAATSASGSASVVNTGSGRRLVLDVSRLSPVAGHFYEVWLIDKDVKKMVSLGILDGSTGQFVIPDGVDVSAYPIVDISVQEPGDPRHSGDSVLRGVIKT
jgi:hypothetical protein